MSKSVIVVPCFNEEKRIELGVRGLVDYRENEKIDCDIIVANNNSSDGTGEMAQSLCKEFGLIYHFVNERGKGACIKNTWRDFDYQVYGFTDVDLSTHLDAWQRAIDEVNEGNDIVIASRQIEGAECGKRGMIRGIASFAYRNIFNFIFRTGIKDLQCGFKFINRKIRDNLLLYLKINDFFFDSEMIVKALDFGYKVKEIPVKWEERGNSSVKIPGDIPFFIGGMKNLYRERKEFRENIL